MGAAGAFAPVVFEKDHFAPTFLRKVILMLRICTHGFKGKVKSALTPKFLRFTPDICNLRKMIVKINL